MVILLLNTASVVVIRVTSYHIDPMLRMHGLPYHRVNTMIFRYLCLLIHTAHYLLVFQGKEISFRVEATVRNRFVLLLILHVPHCLNVEITLVAHSHLLLLRLKRLTHLVTH